ncbi:PREDICTED: c-X-C motif chemokine 16 [Elephantulus edwardii]|uniref:c-X-C motif chemokine 16 n=1 Tax=Elephantulus edwardii TaxID=28737 RepID=UPI0003F093B0|nr:PREDICTED: c-X-C motif chemokine 16 [Elephantulus edwardii]
MPADCKPEGRVLLFLLLATLPVPASHSGDASESSATGNCHCDNPISNLRTEQKEHLRKHLKGYQHCALFVRFQLPSRTVCGSSTQSWVLELMSCFDHKECGHTLLRNRAHQKHLPPPSTRITETTAAEPSDMATSVLTLQFTQQPTLIASTRPLDKSLVYSKETSTPTVGHSLKAGPEAGENQKQLKENAGLLVPKSAIVAVPSLLALVFILIGILLYVLCRKRTAQSRQHCSDLQLQYEPVAPDPNV